MRIHAVVFDLAGLMFDTEALFYRVCSEMLATRGKSFASRIMQAINVWRAVNRNEPEH
jgi:beta-phosphoglucomutase-like phosphatase (HAD superfamily)